MARNRMSKEDRLEYVAKMKTAHESVKTSNFDNNFLYIKSGEAFDIRFLEKVDDMEANFQQIGTHIIGGWKDGKRVRCNWFTTNGEEDCPICEVVNELYRTGDPEDKKIAKQLGVKKKYWFNIIRRKTEEEKTAEDEGTYNTFVGPLILPAGTKFFEQFRSYWNDPRYEQIDHDELGTDFRYSRVGKGRNDTEYLLQPDPSRNAQPLLQYYDTETQKWEFDEEGVDEIYDKCPDLHPYMMPEDPEEDKGVIDKLGYTPTVKLFPYERTVAEFGISLETIGDLDELMVGMDDDDDESGSGDTKRESAFPSKSSSEPVDDEVSRKMAERSSKRRNRR